MIHRYWHGGAPPLEPWLRRVLLNLNPGVELREWNELCLPRELRALADACAGQVRPVDWIRHRANIVRLGLLFQFGGWWYDHDVIPLRPVQSLPFPAVGAHGTLCNSFLAFPAGDARIGAALDIIRQQPASDRPSRDVSGEALLDTLLVDVPRLEYQFDSSGRCIQENAFAVHLYNAQRR